MLFNPFRKLCYAYVFGTQGSKYSLCILDKMVYSIKNYRFIIHNRKFGVNVKFVFLQIFDYD